MKRANKHVIVTGGAQGIGRIVTEELLNNDYRVSIFDIDNEAMEELTHAMAVSLAPDVRVNSISPGWIDVSAIKKKTIARQVVLSKEDHLQHPAGRVGNALDIARMVLFLMDTENSFITGQNFTVDGGMTRKMIYV